MSESGTVATRDASTVVLVRDRSAIEGGGIEVFLQRRVEQMAFAGGMTVFPGGGVDPRDRDVDLEWVGLPVDGWAQVFSADEAAARALVCAAVRETFEECGVLLAGTADAVHADPGVFAVQRQQLVAKELSFAQFLQNENLVLRADLLTPLAHWITPKNEKRRYDTRFFLAQVPAGQEADGETTEAADTSWMTAAQALAAWQDGSHFLLPPTWTQLRHIGQFATVAELLAAPVDIHPIEPGLSDGKGVRGLTFADSATYLAALDDGRLDRLTGAAG